MTSDEQKPVIPKKIAFIEDDGTDLLKPKRLSDPRLAAPERHKLEVERFVLGKKEKKTNPLFKKIGEAARKAGLLSVISFATFLVVVIMAVVFYVLKLYS